MRNKGKKTIDETHPELAAEWDYDKNGELSPQQITSGSARDIWWKCENGHSFQLRVSVRTDGKTAPDYAPCPYCSHKRPTPGEYSLQTEYPELMEEWDWEANIAEGLDPDNLLPRSARKAHWVCKECGHHWASTIARRSSNSCGCPKCAKEKMHKSKKFQSGVNDLATMCPDIAAEWSDKNNKRPEEVHYGSIKSYWWKCAQGHEWKT